MQFISDAWHRIAGTWTGEICQNESKEEAFWKAIGEDGGSQHFCRGLSLPCSILFLLQTCKLFIEVSDLQKSGSMSYSMEAAVGPSNALPNFARMECRCGARVLQSCMIVCATEIGTACRDIKKQLWTSDFFRSCLATSTVSLKVAEMPPWSIPVLHIDAALKLCVYNWQCCWVKFKMLQVGAQVVLLRNLDLKSHKQLVNGTRGVVIGFREPQVTFEPPNITQCKSLCLITQLYPPSAWLE